MGRTGLGPRRPQQIGAPRPPNPGTTINRPRIVSLIERCSIAQICIIQAPQNCGKSVALHQWSSTTDKHVAWLVLDEDATSTDQFWRQLIGTVRAHFGLNPSLVDVPRLLANPVSFIAAQLAGAATLTVIVDNYHLIQHNSLDRDLLRLVGEAPELSLVLTPRLALGIETLQLTLNLDVQTIDATDLAFTGEEASQFHAGTALHAVSNELNSVFQGLPLGHKMAQSVAYRPLPRRAPALTALIVDRATELVKQEILELGDEVLTPEITALLTATLPLEHFDPALLEALAPGAMLQPAIDSMVSRNLIMVSNTANGVQYRQEAITKGACKSVLAVDIAASQRRILDTAAAFEFSRGEFVLAFIYAIENQDYSLATLAMLRSGVTMASNPDQVVLRTLPRVPTTELFKHPLLMLMLGTVYYTNPDTHARGLEYFNLVITAAELAEKNLPTHERLALYLARTVALRLTGQFETAAASARTALKNFGELSLAKRDSLQTFESIAFGQWSLTLLLTGDYETAQHALQQSTAAHQAFDSPETYFFSVALLAYRHALDGDLQLAERYAQMAAEALDHTPSIDIHQQTPLFIARAMIELGKLDPERAAEYLKPAMEHVDCSEFWGQLRTIEARIDLLRGHAGVALARFEIVMKNKQTLPAVSPVGKIALAVAHSGLLLATKNAAGAQLALNKISSRTSAYKVAHARINLSLRRPEEVVRTLGVPLSFDTAQRALEAQILLTVARLHLQPLEAVRGDIERISVCDQIKVGHFG